MNNATPLPADVIAALAKGRKIDAIKLMREQTGLGLKEAKDAVDAYAYVHAQPGDLSPGEVRGPGGAVWWITGLALVGLAAYLLLGRT